MDERSNANLTGQGTDQNLQQHGLKTFDETQRLEPPSEAQTPHEVHRHPIGAGVGALLAAGTGGATGGVLAGPVGAVVGAVIGAIAGSYGGKAIAELRDPIGFEATGLDEYTRRIHGAVSQINAHETQDSTKPADTHQAPRETWAWLDQTPKEMLTGDSPPASDP